MTILGWDDISVRDTYMSVVIKKEERGWEMYCILRAKRGHGFFDYVWILMSGVYFRYLFLYAV